MNKQIKNKLIKIILTIVFAVVLLFVIGILVLKYQVEGETNLPFKISKITIVSSSEGIENADGQNKWNININQNNDIYLYIDKNESYGRTEIIESVIIDNFQIESESNEGENHIYTPEQNATQLFKNTEENLANEILIKGELQTNLKKHEISNQGGLLAFRYSKDNLGNYISNDEDEINFNNLLSKIQISNEELKASLTFDITIKLVNKTAYKSSVTVDLPVGDIINNETQSVEITDLQEVVFKRVVTSQS
ncbi:MAG: hypothetical protein IJV31_03205 [Clostridia bacterium]|nr:hypothetical protein [Clostridia bacterium]